MNRQIKLMLALTPKIHQAIVLASQLHFEKFRKGIEAKAVPYIVHPFSVAWILAKYTSDEDVIVAALLHDVLEDVPKEKYSGKDLRRDFGEKVYRIVKEVSEDKDASITKEEQLKTWTKRKTAYIKNLATNSEAALFVCCADKIHNLQAMVVGLNKYGEKYFKNFNAPAPKRDKYIWYYGEILKILKRRLKNKIVYELECLYKSL